MPNEGDVNNIECVLKHKYLIKENNTMKKTKKIISFLLTIQMLLACALIPGVMATDMVVEAPVIEGESFEELIPVVANECTDSYEPDENGYFGSHGDSSSSSVRHMSGGLDASISFFNWISARATSYTINTSTMKCAKYPDNSYVTWRASSNSDGTPVVEINQGSPSFYRSQKIHFTN